MRQFYPFLLVALLLASWGRAATRYYQANLTFSENAPVCYDTSDANSKLVLGESFRAFVVQDTRATDARDTDPCKIDAAGQIVPAEGLTLDNFKWYTIEVPTYDGSSFQVQTWAKVTHEEGVPARKSISTSVYHSLFLFIEDEAFSTVTGAQTYCYVVAFDTRDEDGACTEDPNLASAPVRPRRYALRKCIAVSVPSSSGLPGLPGGGAKYVALGYEDTSVDAVVEIPNEWQDVVAIQSWTKADGTPLTVEELEAFLKPEMTAFASATDAAGGETFTLAATSEAEDITYYTLYTKAALSDASWTPFNAVMADKEGEMREKGLDNYLQKDYTRCRLNGEGPLAIPLIPGDTGRFYLLRATGNE